MVRFAKCQKICFISHTWVLQAINLVCGALALTRERGINVYIVHCTLYTVQERKEIKQSLSSLSSWWSHSSPPSPLAHLPRLGCSRVSFLHFLIISSFNSFLKRSILLRSRRVFFFLVSLLFSSFILFFYAKKTLDLNFFTRIYL